MLRFFVLTLFCILAPSCATNLALMQGAKTLAPGKVRAAASAGVYIPATQLPNAVGNGVGLGLSAARSAATTQKVRLEREDLEPLVTSALALATLPPSTGWETNLRVGVAPGVDAGLRYSVNAVRLDAKWQFLHREWGESRGVDLALGAGVSRYLFQNPVLEVLEYLQMGDFSRWDVEVPVYASLDFNRWVGLYGGVRYVYSDTALDATLVGLSEALDETGQAPVDLTLPRHIPMHFAGTTFGIRATVWKVTFYTELTGGYTWLRPQLLGRKRDLGGVTLSPAFGMAVAF